jgi:hypothetical protein
MRAQARRFPPLRTLLPLLLGLLLTVGATESPAFAVSADPGVTGAAAPDRAPSRSRDRAPQLPAAEGWSGFAFDACRAPAQRTMDRWLRTSPFIGVGVYIGGSLRACPQRHLSRKWVGRQLRAGWKLLPIWVGPQASCTGFHRRISPRPGARGRYPWAHQQGLAAARGARAAARALGIPAGSTLWYDLEYFSAGNHRCRRSSLRFLSAWTEQLHRSGYRSGVYSSLGSAIQALNGARGRRTYTAPDHVWFAWANYRADTSMRPYVRDPRWKQHQRVHQFALDVTARYGGIRMDIDRNFVDLGRPSRRARAACGTHADLRDFPKLRAGSTGRRVRAAQCLLRAAGHLRGRPTGSYGPSTQAAVRRFQHDRHLKRTGTVDQRTWTALLARGARAVVKRGFAGPEVRRVQRALNAALPSSMAVSGFFGPGTTGAVRRYQSRVGIAPTGVVAAPTWDALAHGRLGRPHHAKSHATHDHKHHHGRQGKPQRHRHHEQQHGRHHHNTHHHKKHRG